MSKQKQTLEFERIIGVKFLNKDELPKDFRTVKKPGVISFCDAFRLLEKEKYAEGIIVTGDSIKICHWSPVALGLKKPETDVQKNIVPLFDKLNHGVFIFNIGKTSKDHTLQNFIDNPDIVTLVGTRENVTKSIEEIGIKNFTKEYFKQLEYSAVSLFSSEVLLTKKEKRKMKRHLRSIKIINWLFASKLMNNKLMMKTMNRLMKKYRIIKIMDNFLPKYGTGMSCCYASTSIPYATQKANVTLTDSGSIGWGGLSKKSMLLGLPYDIYKKIESIMLLD